MGQALQEEIIPAQGSVPVILELQKSRMGRKYLDAWCRRAMRSRLKPMKAVARILRAHRELLLNWFRTKDQVALGAVEGLNNKAKVTSKKHTVSGAMR